MRHLILLTVMVSLILTVSCAKQMDLDEAREYALSMKGEAFVPPPRRIDDILALLQKPIVLDEAGRKKAFAKLAQEPPSDASNPSLAKFYYERYQAALFVGDLDRMEGDAFKALDYAQKAPRLGNEVRGEIYSSAAHAVNGTDMEQALSLFRAAQRHSGWLTHRTFVVRQLCWMGRLKEAEQEMNTALDEYRTRISRNPRLPMRYPGLAGNIARMQALVLESYGKWSEAEPHRRKQLVYMKKVKEIPLLAVHARGAIANNLLHQEKLIPAELQARETIRKALGLSGQKTTYVGYMLGTFAKILLAQGRIEDAERLMHESMRIQAGREKDIWCIKLRLVHARTLVLLGKTDEALHQYDTALALLNGRRIGIQEELTDPDFVILLADSGRSDQALELADDLLNRRQKRLGPDHPSVMEAISLRGFAYAKRKDFQSAWKDFQHTQKTYLANPTFKDTPSRWRHERIIHACLQVIAERDDQEAVRLGFMLADVLRGSEFQNAIAALRSRAAANDPALEDLVRKEQDLLHQIKALEIAISNTNGNPTVSLKQQWEMAMAARDSLRREIENQFPDYAQLSSPELLTPLQVKTLLSPGETLVSLVSGPEATFAWAVRHDGDLHFARIPLSKSAAAQEVSHLRRALAPDGVEMLGDIPPFDTQRAYSLYQRLFGPLQISPQDTRHLIVTASGPLATLPFSVLVTKPPREQPEQDRPLFAHYRNIDWLAKSTAVSMVPGIASFKMLREMPRGKPDRLAFLGFGDPIFNRHARANADKDTMRQRSARFKLRAVRVTEGGGNLGDEGGQVSCGLECLVPLPDTAIEIKAIAKASGGNDSDAVLGLQASETAVKSMSLNNRRILAFATHGLLPGDLDGLLQPALALSTPALTGERDQDGLLTADDILRLELDADWVVLSACNSGATTQAGNNAITGLAQSFFYAGARSTLVTMWPVETTSARELTVGIFDILGQNKDISRAEALRQSMMQLMNGPGFQSETTRETLAAMAHPLFWGPFVLIGQ
ncbi:MAG: CHAT domain-containing protein [Desulfobacterales bacterium]|jgi:CHAT domain-containing protein/tetratricopeptide (TPR) repeat protein